jgi:hypothetical protein
MGLEDFFEEGHKRHQYGHDHDYGHKEHHRPSNNYNQHNDIQKQIFDKLQNNPGLKKTVIVAVIVVLAVVLLLVILLFPLILKLLGFVTENGIQGVVETVWKGTK